MRSSPSHEGAPAPAGATKLVDAPDDRGKRRQDRELDRAERSRMEDRLQLSSGIISATPRCVLPRRNRYHHRSMTASLRRLLSRVGLGRPRGAHPDEQPPTSTDVKEAPAMPDSGAGYRSGQAPIGYVPPVDEGRPRH
jgi:hypothetical protein